MTLGDTLGLSDSQERGLVRVLQAGLAGLAVYGAVTFQLSLAVNGAIALGVTFLPALFRREYQYHMDAGLVLWITIALFLHTFGYLGFYKQYQWYDEITHAISSTVVAGIGYAVLRAFEEQSDDIELPPDFRGLFVVVFVVSFGVVWEVFEFGSVVLADAFGVRPPLVVFGLDDIVTDFVFNTVGGVVVALWGSAYVEGVVQFVRQRIGTPSGNRQ